MSAVETKSGRAAILTARIVLLLYVAVIAYLMLFCIRLGRYPHQVTLVNLVPFEEISRFYKVFLQTRNRNSLMNLAGNVVMFMPFGMIVPMSFPKKKVRILTPFLSCLFSLVMELIQYGTRRGSFDVDDLILNTVGGVLGWLIFLLAYHILKNKKAARS